MTRIVRFGPGSLRTLGEVLDELGARRPVLLTTLRGARLAPVPPTLAVWAGVRPHVPVETVDEAASFALEHEADALVGLGGGAAVDTCKAVVVELAARGRPLPAIVAVPTTYAGAEWTSFFGMQLEPGRKGGGADERARPLAAVYDPELTLRLPLADSVGTALNALAHAAEALYHPLATPEVHDDAERGAVLVGRNLEQLTADLGSPELRARVLEGAMYAAFALGESGLCLAHALAQALGGRLGLPHGAMNSLCLPVALEFNAVAVPGAVTRFAAALGVDDAPARLRQLARLGGFERLRDFGVEESALLDVAATAAARPGARANPRPADAAAVLELLRAIY